MTDVSVITAVRVRSADEARWLEECLISVRNNEFEVEHIVVDDGSETPLAEAFRAEYPHVRWLRNEQAVGPGAARNMGIRAAAGAYVFPLDGDDHLCRGSLALLWDKRCDGGYVYGQLWGFSDEKPEPALLRHDYNFKRESLIEMTGPIGINALYSKRMWAAVGGYREDMAGLEDIEFWIRAAERGYCGAFFAHRMVEYRQHKASRTTRIFESGEVREIRARIQEWHAPFFGGQPMACKKCPQGQTRQEQVMTQFASQAAPSAPDGLIPLKYIGPKSGSFNTPRSPAGNFYRVHGKGDWINVYPDDVDFFLNLRYAGQPEYQRQLVTVQPATILPEHYQPAPIPDAAPVADITDLGQTEALARIDETTDADTLRVWMAMEKAREKGPRGRVVGALRKQMEPGA